MLASRADRAMRRHRKTCGIPIPPAPTSAALYNPPGIPEETVTHLVMECGDPALCRVRAKWRPILRPQHNTTMDEVLHNPKVLEFVAEALSLLFEAHTGHLTTPGMLRGHVGNAPPPYSALSGPSLSGTAHNPCLPSYIISPLRGTPLPWDLN